MSDAPTHTRGIHRADVLRLLAAWASSTAALVITGWVVPGLDSSGIWAYALAAAAAGIVGLLLRPLLVEISARLGWIVLLLVALLGQAVIMYLSLLYIPGIEADKSTAFWATWVSAIVGTLIAWATTAGTDEGLVRSLAQKAKRAEPVDDPDVEGVLFVQLDGVPFHVLRWAVQSGSVPHLRRLLSSGDYTMRQWTVQIPCTTPASQQGILHGTIDGIPAFRWYDRELGRLLVANKPADAKVIEERASDGSGLLYDDGVSISNLFTGDAPRSLLTMSRAGANRGSAQTRRAMAWFLTTPSGFMRSLTRTVGEIVKERFQARRQVRRDLEPRVHRGWVFALLRSVTNALLRDLNTALVAEEMRRGTRSIYVDYVDYDEIAHHAGMFRPESLASLDGLDRTMSSLARLAEMAPRRYRIVMLSDHGQSQGTVFADLHGQSLADLCSALMKEQVQSVDASVEGLGRVDSIAGDLGTDGVTGKLANAADKRITEAAVEQDGDDPTEEPIVVIGSGNLGLVYVRGERRLTLQDLERQWPALVTGLAQHPGIAFVVAIDEDGVPWAMGSNGRRNLLSGEVDGDDPMAPFEDRAPERLLRAALLKQAPDLYVNSVLDPVTNDVAAFEGLVGSHGGLGGWQDHGFLMGPTDLMSALPERIEGADQLHQALVGMLETCGQRLTPPVVRAPAADVTA